MRFFIPTLLLLVACGSPPAPASIAPLEVVGANGSVVVDADWVRAHPSTIEWGEGRAWQLGPILGAGFHAPSARLSVTPRDGATVVFPAPSSGRDGRETLLVINRKGDAIVTLGHPTRGPGSFHGRGGARKRGGDAATRVENVSRIELEQGEGGALPAPSRNPQTIAVGNHGALALSDLDGIPELPFLDDGGDATGQTFRDLRAVSSARWDGRAVTTIHGSDPTAPIRISPEAWADAARVPCIRINKRGSWRFQWVDASGRPLREEPGMRDVSRIQLLP